MYFCGHIRFYFKWSGINNTNNYDHDANPNTPDLSLDLGGQNIALVPGTNVPVSAVNVHTNKIVDLDLENLHFRNFLIPAMST